MSEEIKNETVEENEDINTEETEVQEEKAEEPSREEQLEAKVSELEDRYMRLAAEYDNYKKRTQREKEARYTDALVDTVAAILPIADNLERAALTVAETEEAKKIQEGVVMIAKQIDDVFAKLGVAPIDATGKEFDPNLHNAVMHIEDDAYGENIVAEELMKGYMYKDTKVVRHSMVKVAN